MKKKLTRSVSSSEDNPTGHTKHSIWSRLVEPAAEITEPSERRQASLISAILFILTVTMISGVIYMGFFSTNPTVGIVLAGADFLTGIAYLLSRTRHYRWAAILSLIILAFIPIMNVTLSTDRSSEALLIMLIWNTLTILISSAITTTRNTVIFAVINVLTLLLLPAIIPAVTYIKMVLPLIFNIVISLTILVFTRHRNMIEKDRLFEISKINKQLQIELTERKRAEDQLVHIALHDALTNLPNRVLFMDRLQHAMARAGRHKDYLYAVLFLDLDRFKVVNDSLGHNIGDLLLIETAKRLETCLRSQDTVARLGGDEFVILLEDVKDTADAIHIAERIQNELSSPYDLEDHRLLLFASMGIVFSNNDYNRAEDIVRDADIAMYRAKGHGLGRYEIFDTEMLDHVMTRLELEKDLLKAMENHELLVHYQPILDMSNQQITGFEALLRWQHPIKGLLQPADFIPTAEETGLIIPIGYWVLDEACRQIRIWQKQYHKEPPLTISVNLSTKQCTQPDLIQNITNILQKYELDAGSLKLELTESIVVEDTEIMSELLVKLRDLGIQVQIDDFGTGYSSLGYLHNLPIQTIKIDRSFISRLETNESSLEIVRTILSMAHNLGMAVIAEGVETDNQLSELRNMKCEYIQGFLFAEPVDSQEAGKLLRK